MKICIFGNTDSPHLKVWLEMYQQFKNIHFYVITLNPKPESIKTQQQTVNIKYISIYSKWGLPASLFKLKRIIKQINPQIFHCHSAGLYGLLSYLINARPLILTTYGTEVYNYDKKGPIYKWILSQIIKQAERLTCTSAGMKKFLEDRIQVPSDQIYHFSLGVDTRKFQIFEAEKRGLLQKFVPYLKQETTVFFSNRRTLPLYGIHQIIEAFSLTVQTYPDCRLILLKGDVPDHHPYYLEAKDKVKQLGIGDKVNIIDQFITQEEIAELYNRADFFISIPETDQLSLSILEGMACGAVPVLRDIPAYQELKESTKAIWIREGTSVKELSNIFRQLITDKHHLKQEYLPVNQQFVKERGSIQAATQKTRQLYESIAQ